MTRQRVVITGGASGMGRALARLYAAEGAALALVDRDAVGLAAVADELGAGGARPLTAAIDVSARSAVEGMAREVEAGLGGVDVLVTCAGVGIYSSVWDTEPADWERILQVNLFGTVYTTLAFLPAMRARGAGHVVHIASMMGVLSTPFAGPYCTSKFGVVGFSRGLRPELAAAGIDVTLINPGVVRSEFMRHATARTLRVKGREVATASERVVQRFERSPLGLSTEQAALGIRRAIRQRRREVMLGADAHLAAGLARFAPGLTDRVLGWLVR